MSSAEAAPLASPSKSADAAAAATGDAPDADLPKALMKRILKARLAQWDAANGGDGTREFQINKVGGWWVGVGGGVERRESMLVGPSP